MATVGLFFAPIAPLVSVAAMVVFWISSWVYKYQLMFVFVSQVETGGVSSLEHRAYCTVRPNYEHSDCGTLSSTGCSLLLSSCNSSCYSVRETILSKVARELRIRP